jgi:hypothetical protein
MAIRIIRCSGRDHMPPIAYGGPIHSEVLEKPPRSCPLLVFMELISSKKEIQELKEGSED